MSAMNDMLSTKTPAARRYFLEFGLAMAAYVIVLLVSIALLKHDPAPIWRAPIAVAPAVPAFFGLVALIRHLGRLDELQRRIMLDASAFAAGSVAIMTFAYGFLEENAGLPHVSLIHVLPLTAVMFGLAATFARRRYA